jgi:3-oxoadipate enol-lactonase
MMHRPDSTPLLAQVSVPTLVITGAEDEMIPVEESRRMAAAVRGAKLVIIPAAGHLANLEQPDAFNNALNAFLTSL